MKFATSMAILLLAAAPLQAQVGSTPPPGPPVDLAAPAYTGPVGTAHNPVPDTGTPGHEGPRPHGLPGPRPHAPGGGASSGSGDGASGSTGGRASSGSRRGGATRGGHSGGRRGKLQAWPWLVRVRVPWKAAFLPANPRPGYQGLPLSVPEAIRLDAADGGWMHPDAPVVVLRYDSRARHHADVLKQLQRNTRFRTAAHMFTCFSLDVAGWSKKVIERPELVVYDRRGSRLARLGPSQRWRDAFDVLRRAWRKVHHQDLRDLLPEVQKALNALAHAEGHLEWLQPRLIDSLTGKLDDSVARDIARTHEKQRGWRRWLEDLPARASR